MSEACAMPVEAPILYSFRRCPYAIRARMAIAASGQTCALREVVLRNKPPEMIAVSPKATVPLMVLPDGRVIEESLEIMHWSLDRHDLEGWLTPLNNDRDDIDALIAENDGP
ncbi:MAG: glutathione S-transferase N-terminal domain-containing protein, partial [Alphaproteobacteria bacterium]